MEVFRFRYVITLLVCIFSTNQQCLQVLAQFFFKYSFQKPPKLHILAKLAQSDATSTQPGFPVVFGACVVGGLVLIGVCVGFRVIILVGPGLVVPNVPGGARQNPHVRAQFFRISFSHCLFRHKPFHPSQSALTSRQFGSGFIVIG